MTDKQDILERLQSLSRSRGLLTDADRSTTSKAATEIEALHERVRELEGVVTETADTLEVLLWPEPDMPAYDDDYARAELQLDRARQALSSPDGDGSAAKGGS